MARDRACDLQEELNAEKAKVAELLEEQRLLKENQGDAGAKLEMLQRKYKNLEDQMEKDKETWMIKEKDLKEKIRVIEQLKRDLEAEVSKLEKNLNEATKNNKGDNM